MSGRRAARRVLAAGLALAALAGCPLPQPTPGVGQVPGRTYTPPRIITGSVVPSETIVDYEPDPAKCPTSTTGGTDPGALFEVSATAAEEITTNTVVARWFVDYAPKDPLYSVCRQENVIPPPTDTAEVQRPLPTYTFRPADFETYPAVRVHVVEVVISTAFASTCLVGDQNHNPATGYETQLFRWIFNPVATGGFCTNPP